MAASCYNELMGELLGGWSLDGSANYATDRSGNGHHALHVTGTGGNMGPAPSAPGTLAGPSDYLPIVRQFDGSAAMQVADSGAFVLGGGDRHMAIWRRAVSAGNNQLALSVGN